MENKNQGYGKEAIRERFDKAPSDLFHYVELGLISGNDYLHYMKLLSLYNNEIGYAFPTINQLCVFLNKSTKSIVESNKRLQKYGLLEILERRGHNNNCYKTVAPFTNTELDKLYPTEAKKFLLRKEKLLEKEEQDKQRLAAFVNEDKNNHM
ncbi:helix-turn-helix domain-containing protein [Lysinibacillus endophyticus]|uniref:helix-turn-helix domain-containing protein n=1 Tax=Ureibacillus endophyticus TaxID=1978490 RepID=UPI00209E04C4|nr:helix-turn-helix domain-containing protein [Lysinibacillus endophyticus]MCP1145802.1 helix-turn-helix domain-containing protein [Lysinibacillus endophyticus]